MSRPWFSCALVLSGALVCLTMACQQNVPDTRMTDEQAIRAADAEWLKAVQANDLDRVLSFYADDASELPIEEPIVTGKGAIRKQ
jgi:hypothetical protein